VADSKEIHLIGEVRFTIHKVDLAQEGPYLEDLGRLTVAHVEDPSFNRSGYFYTNPGYTVEAPTTMPEEVFCRHAERALILWKKRVAQVFGRAVIRRLDKRLDWRERIMVLSGFLMVKGKAAHPKRIRSRFTQSHPKKPVGEPTISARPPQQVASPVRKVHNGLETRRVPGINRGLEGDTPEAKATKTEEEMEL
jgi:hypothetical protein